MTFKKFAQLLEKFEDAKKKNGIYVEIYKNPDIKEIREILKNFQEKMLRGLVRKSGELFVLSDEEVIHDNLMSFLADSDIIESYNFWYLEKESLNNFLCVDRQKNGIWKPAESYTFDIPLNIFKEYKEKMKRSGYELLQQ